MGEERVKLAPDVARHRLFLRVETHGQYYTGRQRFPFTFVLSWVQLSCTHLRRGD